MTDTTLPGSRSACTVVQALRGLQLTSSHTRTSVADDRVLHFTANHIATHMTCTFTQTLRTQTRLHSVETESLRVAPRHLRLVHPWESVSEIQSTNLIGYVHTVGVVHSSASLQVSYSYIWYMHCNFAGT